MDEDLDATFVRRIAERDPAALERCFRVHGTRVWRLARAVLGQGADADDATQEIFLRVQEKAASFDGTGSFAGWLRRLAMNHCLNRLERRRREEARHEPHPLERVAATPRPELETAESVERALALLPDEQRTVLVLRELEGASYREIAETLAIPLGTVMSRLARARERLLGTERGASRAREGAPDSQPMEVARDD